MLKLTMSPRKRSRRFRRGKGSVAVMEAEAILHQKGMLKDNLSVLLAQERSGHYKSYDYLSMTAWQYNVYQLLSRRRGNEEALRHPPGVDTRIDEYCREQIVEWSFRVVDYFRIDREVVAVSLSFLDRFLATCRCDRMIFKLAATTTLYLAVKLLHPCKLGDLGILSDLSRGEFNMNDVAEMESHILRTLGWHLHPPTSVAFATLLLDYLLCDRELAVSTADVDDIYDITSFFTELAVCDYFFVPLRPNSTAVACILNALEGIYGPDNKLEAYVVRAAQELGVCTNQDLSAARNRLWELYERSEECALHNDRAVEEERIAHTGGIFVKKVTTLSSPVSVTKPCTNTTSDLVYAMRVKTLRNGSW